MFLVKSGLGASSILCVMRSLFFFCFVFFRFVAHFVCFVCLFVAIVCVFVVSVSALRVPPAETRLTVYRRFDIGSVVIGRPDPRAKMCDLCHWKPYF